MARHVSTAALDNYKALRPKSGWVIQLTTHTAAAVIFRRQSCCISKKEKKEWKKRECLSDLVHFYGEEELATRSSKRHGKWTGSWKLQGRKKTTDGHQVCTQDKSKKEKRERKMEEMPRERVGRRASASRHPMVGLSSCCRMQNAGRVRGDRKIVKWEEEKVEFKTAPD